MEVLFNSKQIKDIIKLLSLYNENYNIIFNSNFLKLYCVNKNHFGYVLFENKNFEVFKHTKNINAGINIVNLYSILKTYDNSCDISFIIEETNLYDLFIIQKDNLNKSIFKTKITLFEMNNNSITNFDMMYDLSIELDTYHFIKLIKYIYIENENIDISVENNFLIFKCNDKECKKTILNTDYKFKKTCNIEFIKNFVKFNNISNKIKLYLKNDFPIITEYNNSCALIRFAFNGHT